MPIKPRPSRRLFIPLAFAASTACSAGAPNMLRTSAPALDRLRQAGACTVEGAPKVVGTKVLSPRAALDGATVVAVDADRSIRAWTEESLDNVLDVLVDMVDGKGRRIGLPVTIAHKGSAMGEPAAPS